MTADRSHCGSFSLDSAPDLLECCPPAAAAPAAAASGPTHAESGVWRCRSLAGHAARSRCAASPPSCHLHSSATAQKNSVFDATISKMRQICCTHKSLSETPSEPIFGQVEASTLTALIVRNFSAKNEVNRPAASRNMTFQILPMKILHDPSYDQQGTGYLMETALET